MKLTAVLNATGAGTAGEALRVERKHALQPLDRIGEKDAEHAEQQHRDGIAAPALLLVRIDAADAVEPALDRPEEREIFRRSALVEFANSQAPNGFAMAKVSAMNSAIRIQPCAVVLAMLGSDQKRSGRASTATR